MTIPLTTCTITGRFVDTSRRRVSVGVKRSSSGLFLDDVLWILPTIGNGCMWYWCGSVCRYLCRDYSFCWSRSGGVRVVCASFCGWERSEMSVDKFVSVVVPDPRALDRVGSRYSDTVYSDL